MLDVTTDMGSQKRNMEKSFGLDHHITITVPRSATPDRTLFFMPGVSHLVKSVLVRGLVLIIALTSNEVSVVLINDLLTFQDRDGIKNVSPFITLK